MATVPRHFVLARVRNECEVCMCGCLHQAISAEGEDQHYPDHIAHFHSLCGIEIGQVILCDDLVTCCVDAEIWNDDENDQETENDEIFHHSALYRTHLHILND